MRRQEMAKHWEKLQSRQSDLTKFPVIEAAANREMPIRAKSAITKAWSIGDKSPYRSLTRKKANGRRKLVRWPVCDSYLSLSTSFALQWPAGIDAAQEGAHAQGPPFRPVCCSPF
jgi:hypothetical protein